MLLRTLITLVLACVIVAVTVRGEHIWQFNVSANLTWPAGGAKGLVYVGATDASLYGINASNGAVAWSYLCNDTVLIPPFYNPYTSMVYVIDSINGLHMVDAEFGVVRHWRDLPHTATGMQGDNQLLVILTTTGFMTLDPLSGGIKAIVSTRPGEYVTVLDGDVYVAKNVIQGQAGAEAVQVQAPTWASTPSFTYLNNYVAANGPVIGVLSVFFCDWVDSPWVLSHNIAALDKKTGQLRWNISLPDQPNGAPMMTYQNTVLVPTNSGFSAVHEFEPSVLWNVTAPIAPYAWATNASHFFVPLQGTGSIAAFDLATGNTFGQSPYASTTLGTISSPLLIVHGARSLDAQGTKAGDRPLTFVATLNGVTLAAIVADSLS